MPLPQRILSGRRVDGSIGALVEGARIEPTRPDERQLLNLVVPPFQRQEVWDQARKVAFIEGIFQGFGTGVYVVVEADWRNVDGQAVPVEGSGWIIDGQQRISAIRDFLQSGLVVFGDVTYDGMSEADKRRFLRQPFPSIEVVITTEVEQLRELYLRMNFSVRQEHTQEDRDQASMPLSEAVPRPRG